MDARLLGGSGLNVPCLSLGTGTFGGGNEFFRQWGTTDVKEATRLVDIALEAGACLFDSANVYSGGLAEEVLGKALAGKRSRALISTKAAFRLGTGLNDVGASRQHLTAACEASLRRLGTDTIDLWQVHGFDAMTPVEETLRTLDDLVRAGKVRYVGCSNYSGWHLMKSLAASDRYGWPRYVAHQAYYNLAAREFEWDLMPLGLDQKVGTVVWSPLAQGKLTGKIGRGRKPPEGTRVSVQPGPVSSIAQEQLYAIVDALDAIATETGRSPSQIALNWVLHRPTVATVVIGARNEEQLRDNLRAAEFRLTPVQLGKLESVSARMPFYPYWHQQRTSLDRNPPAVPIVPKV
jgi:aryl-alcohol dehydrogenase-like predicted oxidoreductase